MKTNAFLMVTIILCFIFPKANAQQTGNFNTTVTFMNQSRTLACHVPTNYDSTNNCQLMVCLHGLGDNATNFRNALINSLNWPSIFPNTIFICPDGGSDANKDFYQPSGDELIIDECISFAKQNYSIDTNQIILEGFSLGGRSALKYGLDFPEKFKGLLLNTPAIQGLADAINDTMVSLGFNYANASHIPIYTTIGGEDILYAIAFEKVHELLKKNDGIVKVVEVNGLGHTIPYSNFISPSLQFYEDPSTKDYDIDLFEIEMIDRSCDPIIFPKCYVRNLGSKVVTSLEIEYDINGNTGTFTWTGNLDLYEHTLIKLPQMALDSGTHLLELSIGMINNLFSDSMIENNILSKSIEIALEGNSYPLIEGFEGEADKWIFEETGSLFSWFLDDVVKKDGLYSIGTFNTILLFYTNGYSESFMSPVMDLTSVPAPQLYFDIAYNYHKYTPPYFIDTVFFADTLMISISTDCGQNYETIFKEGGADLATAKDPILNPLTIQDCFFSPKSDEWDQKVIDLSSYSGFSEAIVKFTYTSNMGGSINIDNISFKKESIAIEEGQKMAFRIFPNPAQDILNIEVDRLENSDISLFDVSGRKVLNTKINNFSNQIDISGLSNGFYSIEILSGNVRIYEKVLIVK
ncbi:MAG: T9SS type A sorting domain-containing protein [Bacteroidetes bacterium]|nr:T9SS type A sorting domain-containing protein [Bacteroidota bacterium]